MLTGEQPPPWHYWLFAILATLVGNSCITLGLMIQKKAHRQCRDNKDLTDKWYFLNPMWLGGLLVFFVGHVFCCIGSALGAQTVLACFNCWTMVLTCLFASCMLGESLSLGKIFAISRLVFGCVLVAIHGSRQYDMLTVEKIHQSLTGVVFLGLCACSLLVAIILTSRMFAERQTQKSKMLNYLLLAAQGGWYAVLISKTLSGLTFTSLYHQDDQMNLEFWILCLVFLGFAAANIHFLNLALSQGEATFVIPVYEAMAILGQVTLGGFFFDEFHGISRLRLMYYFLGVGIVISGVLVFDVPGPKSQDCVISELPDSPDEVGA